MQPRSPPNYSDQIITIPQLKNILMDVLDITPHQMTQKEKENKINKIIEKNVPPPTVNHPTERQNNQKNNQTVDQQNQITTPAQVLNEKTKASTQTPIKKHPQIHKYP